MEQRSEELRRIHRRIFGWSLGVAALVHLGVFAFSPEFRSVLPDTSPLRAGALGGDDADEEFRWIDVTFGPPTIRMGDGRERHEPPDRWLEAREVNISGIGLEAECQWVRQVDLSGAEATVNLTVGWNGRVTTAIMADGSGEGCVDEVLVAVAETLWYRWLPDDEATAPVDLIQPMWVTASK